MCRVLKIHRSGFYAWLDKPLSDRSVEDQRLLGLIQQYYLASGATYGSPWIHRDLRDAGERCSVHRVAKIMRANKLRAQIGYKRRYIKGGKPVKVADNVLNREFSPEQPNRTGCPKFYPIRGDESYHQDYCINYATRYNYYRWRCGRDQRLRDIWGDKATH